MKAQFNNLSEQYASKPDNYYELERAEMLPFVPESCKSVLEVGCSSGAFGELLKKQRPNCIVWGIEPDRQSAHNAELRLDHVIHGEFSADHPDLRDRQFDVICFNDVLEHLTDPERILTDCKRLLAPHGVVVASLPNILFFYQITKILIEQDWRYEESGIMDNTHLRFFTKKSIRRMFENSGYRVEEITGINPSYGLKYIIANALTFGKLADWKYVQFAVRSRVAS